ncbi:MAG TPA: glycosyltransferase family 2 protein [Streptosporangiaceae bacterium]|nr:glycosyltransferase family 2 protein [Streptosporangiaceae bacterium]
MNDTAGAPAQTTMTLPVSVIMPVRNEERHLAESVGSILAQDYAGELELLLAVGPSKDHTLEIANKLAATDPRVRVVENPTGQIPAALNLAVGATKHDVIVRVDGHALLPPGYIDTAVRTLRETGAVNVGGIMAAEGISPFQQAVAWAMTSPFGVGSAKYHTGGGAGEAHSVYLGAFRRSAIEGVGGYDERYLRAEDWEMNHRIRQAGGLIWFTPQMRVSYRPRATAGALASQYFHYGRWRHVLARMHSGTINPRYLAPPAAVVAMLAGGLAGVAGLLALVSGAGSWWPWLLLAGFAAPVLYVLGVLAVTVAAARSLHGRALAFLPVVLATMHVAWGTGFLTSPRHLGSRSAR